MFSSIFTTVEKKDYTTDNAIRPSCNMPLKIRSTSPRSHLLEKDNCIKMQQILQLPAGFT